MSDLHPHRELPVHVSAQGPHAIALRMKLHGDRLVTMSSAHSVEVGQWTFAVSRARRGASGVALRACSVVLFAVRDEVHQRTDAAGVLRGCGDRRARPQAVTFWPNGAARSPQ